MDAVPAQCSELLPERITLDEWGYPLLDPAAVAADTFRDARQAVSSCPTRALRLQRAAGNGSAAAPTRLPQHRDG